jgi:hypothetical protein
MISIHENKQLEVARSLEKYIEKGVVNFVNVLSIPITDRLPGLVKAYGDEKIHALMVVMLTDFANNFNVIRPMSPVQIINCAFQMIITANEDQLGIEDFTIFFEGAKQGKYGKVYDRLDQQIIFEMMEHYRDERHKEFIHFKEEQHAQFKAMPVNERIVSDAMKGESDKNRAAINEYLKQKIA